MQDEFFKADDKLCYICGEKPYMKITVITQMFGAVKFPVCEFDHSKALTDLQLALSVVVKAVYRSGESLPVTKDKLLEILKEAGILTEVK